MATNPTYAEGTGGASQYKPPTLSDLGYQGKASWSSSRPSIDRNIATFFGASSFRKANKKLEAEKRKRAQAEAQAKAYAQQQYRYARAEGEIRKGMAGVDKAYQEAKLQSARGAEQARQTVREEGKASGAAATQSMMGRGLYGTTVQDQAQRAVTGDMARSLGMIDTALASEQGQLGVSQAATRAAGLGEIAMLQPQLAGMQTDTMFKFYEAFKPPPPPPKRRSGLSRLLGGALSAFTGGFFGNLGEGMAAKATS